MPSPGTMRIRQHPVARQNLALMQCIGRFDAMRVADKQNIFGAIAQCCWRIKTVLLAG